MRARAYGFVFIAVALSGCIKIGKDDDKVKGTTEAQAAEALTKAVSFQGGTLVDGLMPDSSTSDVSLIPDDGGNITPGQASLMSFAIAPDDANVNAALVQFEGASSHFLIDSEAFDGMLDGGAGTADGGGIADAAPAADGGGDLDAAAGDGGIGSASAPLVTSGRANLVFSVEDDVCADLCDREYEISVVQALQLAGKGKPVTEHQTATFILDCSNTGDHAKCGDSEDTKSDTNGNTPAASSGAERLVSSYFALQAAVCMCSSTVAGSAGGASSVCSQSEDDPACAVKAFADNAEIAATEMRCAQAYIDEQARCIEESMCSAEKFAKCDIVASSTTTDAAPAGAAGSGGSSAPSSGDKDPITAKCGAWPDALQAELDACGGTSSGGVSCADGTPLAPSQRCDGAFNCADRSDESGCDAAGTTMYACGDAAGTLVSEAQLCNGAPDCPITDQAVGAFDESYGVCVPCTDDQSKIYPFTQRCDGKNACADGSDELGCNYPCADGKGSIPITALCDKTKDCQDGSDEDPMVCTGQAGEFDCGDGTLIPVEYLCNGTVECTATQLDEANCMRADAGVPTAGNPGAAGSTAGAAAMPMGGTGAAPADAGL